MACGILVSRLVIKSMPTALVHWEHEVLTTWPPRKSFIPFFTPLAWCSPWGRRVGHDWATELNWRVPIWDIQFFCWFPITFQMTEDVHFLPSWKAHISKSSLIGVPNSRSFSVCGKLQGRTVKWDVRSDLSYQAGIVAKAESWGRKELKWHH